MEPILDTVVLAVLLGILAQVVAEKLRLPAILPLLLFGMAAGPFGLGVLRPERLGDGLEVFVQLGVAVVLFEGGLSLDLGRLRRVGAPLRNLLTLGVAVTWVGAAWLAHAFAGLAWPTAALFGAILTVTGPTVIAPLLRHMIVPRRVRTLLVSEGLIVDPIGAVLAYLVLQSITRGGRPAASTAGELVLLCVVGLAAGLAAGGVARLAARSRLFAGELRNLIILALLFAAFLTADRLAPQSGVLAALAMGFSMSAVDLPDLGAVKVFKGQLTLLFISLLFILLAARLDLPAMLALGWRGLLVAVGLTLLVRPLAVAASVRPSQMNRRERTVLALTAPRGIIAAAVASLAALDLRQAGMADAASKLEGLVYLAILVTGAWATAMAVALPPLLGFADDPKRRLTVFVGANPLAAALAGALRRRGRTVAVVDAVGDKLEPLRQKGILTVRGDARDAATFESAGVERDTELLALTTNDELNLLVADLAREKFGITHPVVALRHPPEDLGRRGHAWTDLLGGRGVDLAAWLSRLEAGRVEVVDVDPAGEGAAVLDRLLREEGEEVLFVCGWSGGQPSFHRDLDLLGKLERVTLLVVRGAAAEALAPFAHGDGDGAPLDDDAAA
jgi:NhaP-type Na+/H+ or K+/H+ antiporter